MNQNIELETPFLPTETQPSGDAVYLDLLRRLNFEARLLDELRHTEWLDMLTEDVIYWSPLVARRLRNEKDKFSETYQGFIFNDQKIHLQMRATRLDSGMVWVEDPVNYARHLVSNVEVFDTDHRDEVKVYSAVDLHRSRLDSKQKRITYMRSDLWRQVEGQWFLARRRIDFDHNGTIDSNLNLFF
jgi:3-phenylpropionate/cinnamic acid dioxygenase small subunit